MHDDISDKQIQAGLWLIKYKGVIKTIATMLMAIVCLIVIASFVYHLIIYISERPDQKQFLQFFLDENVKYTDMHERIRPFQIEIIDTEILSAHSDTFDIIAKVKNNNKTWAAASCDYHFIVSGRTLDTKKTFFLPEEEKHLFEFSFQPNLTGENEDTLDYETGDDLSSNIVIEDCDWQRMVDKSKLPEVNFVVNDLEIRQTEISDSPTFNRAEIENVNTNVELDIYGYPINSNINTDFDNEIKDGESITQLAVSVTNRSVYGFWKVKIAAFLYDQSGNIIAVNSISLDKFLSFEKRNILFNWRSSYPRNIAANMVFYVDILDDDNLINIGDI